MCIAADTANSRLIAWHSGNNRVLLGPLAPEQAP